MHNIHIFNHAIQPPAVATGVSHLAQELIDKIIDCVFDSYKDQSEDNAALQQTQLRTCALISRAFLRRSQKHLFTILVIYMAEDESTPRMTKRLNNVFSMNPLLIRHIRVLKLIVDDSYSPHFSDPNFVACMTHISQRDQPSPNLQIYPNWKAYRCPTPSRNLRRHAFRTHFVPLVASRLTILEINYFFDVPIELLDTCRNLHTVGVHVVGLAPFEESKRVPVKDRPLIRELSVACSEDLICRAGLRLDKLSKVIFRGNMEFRKGDMMTIRHILTRPNANLSYLESLNFFVKERRRPMDARRYPAIGVDFTRMPNLRKVELYVPCIADTFDRANGMDMVAGLAKLLGTTSPEHKLELVYLYFRCVLCIKQTMDQQLGPQDVESHLRGANWASLDSTVIRMTSSIKHPFKLSIHLDYTVRRQLTAAQVCTKDEDALKDWGRKYLPRASESPNLILDVVTTYTERI